MRPRLRGLAKAAAPLALAGGLLAATAMPALAAPMQPPPPLTTESYGASATGPITLAPFALATIGNSPITASHVVLSGLLATGGIQDIATANTVRSRVNDPVVKLGAINATIKASYVSSWCNMITPAPPAPPPAPPPPPAAAYGSATIYNGSITINNGPAISLPSNPEPNTVVDIGSTGATVTLNAQTSAPGQLGVQAMVVSYDGQTVTLGVSQCNAMPGPPPPPPPI